MAIGTSDGEYFEDRFDMLTRQYAMNMQPHQFDKPTPKFGTRDRPDMGPEVLPGMGSENKAEEGILNDPRSLQEFNEYKENMSPEGFPGATKAENEGREQVPLYRGGKNVTPKEPPPPNPTRPIKVDNDHHVPLIASGILNEQGDMLGLAVDHRVKVPNEYLPHLALHEGTEIPLMHDYMADGMSAQDAYHKAHDIATAVESASVRGHAARNGLDPDAYHEGYKQFFRDAAGIAREPTGVDRHPRAHTTVHGLDEAELGQKFAEVNVPANENMKDVTPQHPPLQIDVLGAGTAMHAGPGPFRRPGEYQQGKKPANENKPEGDEEAMTKLYRNNPDLYKYYRARWEQKGGKDWERWQDVEEELYFKGVIPIPNKGLEVIKGGKDVAPTYDRVKELLDQGKESEAKAYLDKQKAKDKGITIRKLREEEKDE